MAGFKCECAVVIDNISIQQSQGDENSWSAYVPDLPGCVAAGDSKEEVSQLIREALEFHIEGMKAEGLPVPEAKADAEHVCVAA